MHENETADVVGVPEQVLDELAQILVEKLDILLDRLTDRAFEVPDAGSAAWQAQWLNRDSDAGREQHARRLYVRAVIASRAGAGLRVLTESVELAPPAALKSASRRGRRRMDADQLTFF
ncbi:hypothetical protein CH254_23600 [Rhodococcus sp. 06-412-2C]|uniref:hypothetical protein n=1 Tax=unclassified Rhodococcus (in: high G+C Gram-positive bacteria) TaxID=192944 RepID=UPI000B9C142F|nr:MULTISPECIES: hypothetical protein [unclassified Rhodococcus (in: high G+C Gram-positive bacteria)]OZC83880.1 hypothetical protein CH254_23600 [Rhodococcus sp. 06-412-2C]OZC94068.1 hypothetical protein CH279_21685 [Rhodococcus sp. 06-412-2B]